MKTKADYFALYATRPEKFTAEEVEFMPVAEDNLLCCSCMNWFISPSMDHSTCQIYRPHGDISVPAAGSCKFWTRDNQSFPHLEE